jgi:endonuclease-3
MEKKKTVQKKSSVKSKAIENPLQQKLFNERKMRITALNKKLKKLFPETEMALRYRSHLELLVAVELSAQCTDKKVNEVTEILFKKYKKLEDYVHADVHEFEKDIKQTGFYKNKAKNILAATKRISEVYGGKVPNTMEEILTIPGVARKTANVVLGNAFGVVDGIAVDTHVRRFVIRYDLSDFKDPVKIERDLMALLPKKEWFAFTYRVIAYGRTIAPARKYDISTDPLVALYPKAGKIFHV